jgi:release factor glutamine methyltransferase
MLKTVNHIVEQTSLSTQQAWWLLEFVTDKSRAQLQFPCQPLRPPKLCAKDGKPCAQADEQLTSEQQQNLDNYIEQIAVHHKPLAYILGWVPFLDLKLFVTPPTLIPRPETESWVYELITMIKLSGKDDLIILDIGTGSGCIALSLAQAFPTAQVYAIDIAQSALDLAVKNAAANNITNITFIQSNLFTSLPTDLKFDLIVSNPPYIDPAAQLEKSVLNWEDHGALFAHNQGMQIIEQIVTQAKNHLKENAALPYQLVMEIDVSQGIIVKKLLGQHGFKKVEIRKDQFDRDRTVWSQ